MILDTEQIHCNHRAIETRDNHTHYTVCHNVHKLGGHALRTSSCLLRGSRSSSTVITEVLPLVPRCVLIGFIIHQHAHDILMRCIIAVFVLIFTVTART